MLLRLRSQTRAQYAHYDVIGKPCPGIIGWNIESVSETEWQKFKVRLSETSAIPAKKAENSCQESTELLIRTKDIL